MSVEITNSAPPISCMTMKDFIEKRGYDPKTRTYAKAEAPDVSGRQLHKLSQH